MLRAVAKVWLSNRGLSCPLPGSAVSTPAKRAGLCYCREETGDDIEVDQIPICITSADIAG